jgi:hypothetical protein
MISYKKLKEKERDEEWEEIEDKKEEDMTAKGRSIEKEKKLSLVDTL